MSFQKSIAVLSTHRSIVPTYFHRHTGLWIVAGTTKNNNGAVVLDADGVILGVYPTKVDAVRSLNSKMELVA